MVECKIGMFTLLSINLTIATTQCNELISLKAFLNALNALEVVLSVILLVSNQTSISRLLCILQVLQM